MRRRAPRMRDGLRAWRAMVPGARPRRGLIRFVHDRPGHDRRYAIDPSKAERDLGWRARETFGSGLARTVDWYLDNDWWWRPLREQRYAGERLGLPGAPRKEEER